MEEATLGADSVELLSKLLQRDESRRCALIVLRQLLIEVLGLRPSGHELLPDRPVAPHGGIVERPRPSPPFPVVRGRASGLAGLEARITEPTWRPWMAPCAKHGFCV